MPTPQSKPQPEANPYMQMMQEDAPADQGNPYSLGPPDTKTPPLAAPNGLVDALRANWHSNVDPQDTGHPVSDYLHNAGGRAAQFVTAPFLHPIQAAKGIARSEMGSEPMAEQVAGYTQSKHPLADITGDLAGGAALSGLMGAAGEGAEAAGGIKGYLRPTSSPEIVPPAEMAARNLAQAVIPPAKDATPFIKAAPLEVPNIADYARRTYGRPTDKPFNTQLEFSKAAQGSAQEARNLYENQVLGPNDKTVKTTGTGFGRRTGESPETFAKLSDIDKRIVQINKELSPAYGKLNVGDTREALAGRTALEHEVNSLTDILHRNLSQATGIPPEDIANLRQRVGRSFELANDTNAAVTSRMQGEGRTKLADLKMSNIPARLLETIRGGPTAISDRAFQRAIKNYPGEAQPLPQIKPQAAEISPPTAGPKYPSLRSVRQDRETK